MNITREKTFEDAIIASLVSEGGYSQGDAAHYDRDLALDPHTVLVFLQESQPKELEKLRAVHGADMENRLIQRLVKELELNGTLEVLRHGLSDHGVRFRMAYFKPETGLNPQTQALYDLNRLTVTRQVHYSRKNENSIDLLLSINGLPAATVELKNQFTGQDVRHARRQYKSDRNPRELLFQFKKRALVHFAVDQDEVYMTTRLAEDKTRYLPFNQGDQNGAGNPPNPDGYRTAYLWERIWAKDSWLDIIGRFLHLEVKEVKTGGKVYQKESLIFPRYHQLEVVRRLTADARAAGPGKNYLIQHSAGSGKSNSIAWLAYRLSSLHNAQDEKVFDSVIVITDRRVLDQQLQQTIYQFEHKSGVVEKIDQGSTQLAEAIRKGVSIIITTLQKFPFVALLDQIQNLPGRNYAVIVDEAHSSQGGESSKKLKEVLAAKSLEEAETEDSVELDDTEDEIRKSLQARGRQPNLSFFGFTATPKAKTLEVFGERDAAGKPHAFHTYSMRQAIEEKFIFDVLEHYTTYKTYFRLCKTIAEDPQLNKKKASKAIGRFLSLHPHNLAQKTEVIIEHFRQVVSKQIGGKAKAMVVSGSRLHAVRYYFEFKRYIKEKGYHDVGVLVAFSGKVVDDGYPEGVTEPQLTGISEKQLPEVFDTGEYNILLVADKYQYGFDQPLLYTMYVDKKLSGVKAVQTLSRLNRYHPGKEGTFVLDFANERQVILDAFQPYYELTTVEESPDPNHLYDLKNTLDQQQVYWPSEIEAFAKVFFKPSAQLQTRDQGRLYAHLDPAVDRYKALEEAQQDEFKKGLRTWVNLYAFLSQIMPFQEIEFEKFYAFAKLLTNRLPRRNLSEALKLDDEVALEYYRLQKVTEGAIAMEPGTGYLDGITEAGIKRDKDEQDLLSNIIKILNERFGTDFTDADRLFFEQIEQELVEDEKLQHQARNNSLDNFKYGFEEIFLAKLIERMEDNQEIFERILDDKAFGDKVRELLLRKVYRRINEAG